MATSPSPPLPLRLLLRIPVPWVFVPAYLAGAGLQRFFPLAIPSPCHRCALTIAGILLRGLAVTLAGWALALFRRRHTTTTPGNVSRAFRLSRDPSPGGAPLARRAKRAPKGREIPPRRRRAGNRCGPPSSDAARPPKLGFPTRSGARWGGQPRWGPALSNWRNPGCAQPSPPLTRNTPTASAVGSNAPHRSPRKPDLGPALRPPVLPRA